ncbi:MAG: hypothetical protein JSR71_14710 [Proteobacteria bacterium]|nr:hypothetical protein [Pseudomonadota bacterium]MBS1775496.1 hypothetical protein [Bacteroidota bacterium]
MKKIASFLVSLIFLISCSKITSDTNNNCSDYVKGDVIVGIKNTAPIEDVFSLFNKLDLKIDEMSGFFYASPYPHDSLTSLINYLNTKPYINTRNFSASAYVHYQTGIINVTALFFDMTIENQQDWISSKKSFNLVDTKGDTKNILIKVASGQENYWLKALKNYNIVTWTELNCIGQFQPN